MCCRIKPYHFCIQPGPRPRSPPSVLGPRAPPRCAEPARAAGAAARAPRRPGGCSVRHLLRLPAGAGVGRTLGRGGVGWRGEGTGGGAAGRGRRAGGPATVASAETATPQSSSRLQTRASRHAAGPGYTPGATARSCVKARPKSVIVSTNGNRPARRAAFGSGRGAALVVVPGARVRPRDWSRARAILTTDNALARPSVTLATRLATAGGSNRMSKYTEKARPESCD